MNKGTDDPVMKRIHRLWEAKQAKGMTMQELGEAMGYEGDSARKSVHQFLKSRDPQISMLRKFAKAMRVSLTNLVREK